MTRRNLPFLMFLLDRNILALTCGLCLTVSALSGVAVAQNPVPLINQPLVPDAAAPGGKGFTLTVNGTGFVSGSVANWNGSARATTFVSNSQLRANILASDIAKPGTASVTVVSPARGGGKSNEIFFPVARPTSSVGLRTTSYAAGSGLLTSLAIGDFNRDGKPDLAMTDDNNGTVSILLGKGDGTFQSPVNYSAGNATAVVTGDFNGDSKLDLAVTSGDGSLYILLGKGDGTFQQASGFSVGSNLEAIAVGDFNADGKLDLAVSDYALNDIGVLLGKGDGTFQPVVIYNGLQPLAVAVGDFNRDGKLDLVVGGWGAVSVLLGNGDGTFEAPINYKVGNELLSVVVGDLNRDGKLDLAVVDLSGPNINILLGNGDGTFRAPVVYGVGGDPAWAALGDLNGDGKLDLSVLNIGSCNVNVLVGNGDGTFQPATNYNFPPCDDGIAAGGLGIGDFNRDGKLDLAVAPPGSSTFSVLLQAPTIGFSTTSLEFSGQVIGTNSNPKRVTVTNTGYLTLKITAIKITGTNGKDFSQTNTCSSDLPPGTHCSIKVTFSPTHIGPRVASVIVTDNAWDSPQSIALNGTGVVTGPNVTLSTTRLSFATQLVGTTSSPQPVTLSNYGSLTLNITSIVASGDFSEENDCGSHLRPTHSCTISVTFTPTQRGRRTGTVSITDNAPNSPQKIRLTGVATVVLLSPSSLNFGNVQVGQRSSPQQTTLTNTGKTSLHITDISLNDTSDFSESNNCPKYLGAGKNCAITVTFTPQNRGDYNADVSVSDDGGASPQRVSLSGHGCILNFEHRCTDSDESLNRPAAKSALLSRASVAVPGPSGASIVGTRIVRLVDPTRKDPYLANVKKRELLVRFWYPAASGQACKDAAYASPKVWNYFSKLMGIPGPEVHTNSCQDATAADGVHPIVVLEPGYTGTFTDYTFIAEDLASRGYVVAAVAHTYETTAVEFPDGRLVPGRLGSHFDDSWRLDDKTLSHVMATRLADLKFVVDQLEVLNGMSDSPFAGKLNVSRIALIGHSLGVLAVLSGLEHEPRFKAGVTLDGVLIDGFTATTDRPVLMLAMDRTQWSANECKLWGNLHGTRLAVNLKGAEHITPTDAVWLADGAIRTSAMGRDKTIAAVRDYIAAFLNANLKGKAADRLLTGPSSEYPDATVTTQKQLLCTSP